MAEKSDVNDAGVRFTVVGVVPLVGVVGVVLDDDFEELPHADAARTAAATIAIVTTRRLDLLRITRDDPISGFSTSVSCRSSRRFTARRSVCLWGGARCPRRIDLCVFDDANHDGRKPGPIGSAERDLRHCQLPLAVVSSAQLCTISMTLCLDPAAAIEDRVGILTTIDPT
jgi:hypothetical protein